ncbi:MAG: hypothetical protein QW390_00040 [Candidatus Bathyarchaeia archaeon]
MLDFIADMVEERLVKGNLRWLANFKEIFRDHKVGEFKIPLYAKGELREKGFLLSRAFSALVTPRYKVHLILCLSDLFTVNSLRSLIISCKKSFDADDWIFIGLVQEKPLDRSVQEAVKNIGDERVGLVAYSLQTDDQVASRNVLGEALKRQLNLTEARFEAFDATSYLKSFAASYFLMVAIMIVLTILGAQLISPLSLLVAAAFSMIAGYRIYKARYHTVLKLDKEGFELHKGKAKETGEWRHFTHSSIYINPKHETYLRLYSGEEFLDIPLSRLGLSRRDMYEAIGRLIGGRR